MRMTEGGREEGVEARQDGDTNARSFHKKVSCAGKKLRGLSALTIPAEPPTFVGEVSANFCE
jgi:hypothetical protein